MQQMTQTDTIGVDSNATPVAATTHDYHYTYTAGFRGRAKQHESGTHLTKSESESILQNAIGAMQ